LNGTVVCYAGSRQLPAILDALAIQGGAGSQPAAVIFNGTLPAQRTWQGTVDELAAQAKASPPREPSILVVGRVTALRQHLRWFDERPLFGRRIMVTRPREDAAELVDLLTVLGAAAIEAPMTRIMPPDDYGPLDEAIGALEAFDWVLFTSANAVDQFMQRLLHGPGDLRLLAPTRLCTIGPVTRDRLRRYHLKVDLMPDDGHPEAVVQALAAAARSRALASCCHARTSDANC
jgi:uroporphyrinogen III methyltransferase / synthase